MDAGLVLFAIFIVPPLVVAFLGSTKLWWLSGALLFVLAILCLFQIEPSSGEAAGAMTAVGNGIMVISAVVLAGYGLVMLLIGAKAFRSADRRRRQVDQPLPAAKLLTSRA